MIRGKASGCDPLNRWRYVIVFGVLLSSALLALPLLAHHSFSAEYNITATVTLKGEVVDIEWSNPHVFLRLAVRDNTDSIQIWHVEGGAIKAVRDNGWTLPILQQLVKSHDLVIVTGYRGRKDSAQFNEAWGKAIELPDGRSMPFN